MTESVELKPRFYGIDLLRLISLWGVVLFHFQEALFFENEILISKNMSIYANLETLIRNLGFSGFTILTVSSFLMGFSQMNSKKWTLLFCVLVFGLIALGFLNSDDGHLFYFEWDIYSFLLFGFIILYFLEKHKKLLYALSVCSVFLLLYPIWTFDYFLNSYPFIKNIVLGDCDLNQLGNWPLLPWIALILIAFSAGQLFKENNNIKNYIQKFHLPEFLVWLLTLLLLSPWLGTYAKTPTGSGFSCFVHRRPLIEFWAHWLLILFMIRYFLVTPINNYLSSFRWIKFLSQLYWTRYLGLCYALQFLFLSIGYGLKDTFETTRFSIDLFLIFLFVGVELSARLIILIVTKFNTLNKKGQFN